MTIKRMRLIANMTQKTFAEYFDIPIRTLQDWEQDRRTPPDYVVELIKYKFKKERLGMLDFGEYKLKEVEENEMFYVAALDTNIMVSSNMYELSLYNTVGKIRVYHDGLCFGSPDQMDDWIKEKVIEHLISKGHIIQDGETVMGEKRWKISA